MKRFSRCIQLTLLLGLLGASNAYGETTWSTAESLTDRAYKLLRNEQYAAAANEYERASRAWKQYMDSTGDTKADAKISHCQQNLIYALARPIEVELNLAEECARQKRFDEAARLFKSVIDSYHTVHRRLGTEKFKQNLQYATVKHAEARFTHAIHNSGEAPDFDLNGIQGGRVRLSAYRGKPVLVMFWTSWCGYCHRQMSVLNELHHKYQGQGLTIVALSMDAVDGWNRNRQAEARQLGSEVPYASAWATKKVVLEYGRPSSVPYLVWIDADGWLVKIVEKRDLASLESDFATIQSIANKGRPAQRR